MNQETIENPTSWENTKKDFMDKLYEIDHKLDSLSLIEKQGAQVAFQELQDKIIKFHINLILI